MNREDWELFGQAGSNAISDAMPAPLHKQFSPAGYFTAMAVLALLIAGLIVASALV